MANNSVNPEITSDTQMIFTVDNFSDSDSDFQNIRLGAERVVKRDEFETTSPSHWLIFSLALGLKKRESPVISYDECCEIAKEFKLPMVKNSMKHYSSFTLKWD